MLLPAVWFDIVITVMVELPAQTLAKLQADSV